MLLSFYESVLCPNIYKLYSEYIIYFAGIQNSFIFSKNERSRELISYAAFIILVIRYQGAEDNAKVLRNFLLKPLLLPPALLEQSLPTTCTLPATLGRNSARNSATTDCDSTALPPSFASVSTAVPPTPASDSTAVPPTPASDSTAVPPTPASYSTAVPPTPASVSTAVPPTPASDSTAVPPTPASDSTAVPPTPASDSTAVPPTPASDSTAVPLTPASDSTAVPPTPASDSTAVPLTPASDSTAVPPTPASDSTAVPPTPASDSTAVPPTPASDSTAVPPTPASDSTAVPPTPASDLTVVPQTPARNPRSVSSTAARNLSTVLSSNPDESPSIPAGDPISATPSRHQSTKRLFEIQLERRKEQSSGRKFASRPPTHRTKQQNEQLQKIAQDIHHGSKEDLLVGIAHSVSNLTTKQNPVTFASGNDWDGQLTVQDIVDLTKMIHDHKAGKSIYDSLTVDMASQIHHISSFQVLKMQDSISQKETFRNLRKQLPGFFDSERRTDQLKNKWHKEFEIVLQPSRTKTGWRINPERLRKCVSFDYPWLKKVDAEWWRLYGDARNFGGQKSVLLSLSLINNEAMFNDCSFQSPEENCWPIHIFYGSDSRLNLELNIGDGDGYLNTWIDCMAQEGHKTFVASDNMLANAILGGGLDPRSNDNFSIYAFETTVTRSEVGENTGVRSEIKRQIEREHPESLLPAVPTNHFIPCANHMFVRITEHLLTLRVMSCLNEGVVSNDKSGTLTKLLSNINVCGVRGGHFQLKFDGPKLEPISLNVSHAETISAPPEAFSTVFPHIMDGVALKEQFPQPLHLGLQTALGWPTNSITYYDLEKEIWETHWRMHVLCRKDPDPRNAECYLLPAASPGSQSATDYRFGLLNSEIEEYRRLADLHHGLMLLRYGSSRLYPYLMTRVDIVPILLKELPFHSLFRGSTEGGEHCHYLHQCIYYAHSSRGGGWRKEEPILALFKWSYRRLREQIEQGERSGDFLKFVEHCFAEVGRDYTGEFGEHQQQCHSEETGQVGIVNYIMNI